MCQGSDQESAEKVKPQKDLPPDEEVIRLRQGNREAYESLLREYGPKTLGLCRSLLHKSGLPTAGLADIDPLDCLQEAGLRLVQRMHRVEFSRRQQVGSWLMVTAYRFCLDKLKQLGRTKQVEDWESFLVEIGMIRDEESLDDRDYVDHVLKQLDPHEREILLLKYYFGMNAKEIAAEKEISHAAARKRASRALHKLRLSQHEGDGGGVSAIAS